MFRFSWTIAPAAGKPMFTDMFVWACAEIPLRSIVKRLNVPTRMMFLRINLKLMRCYGVFSPRRQDSSGLVRNFRSEFNRHDAAAFEEEETMAEDERRPAPVLTA